MIKKVQLKNGMTVIKNLQTKSPVVSIQVWVENGSANETEEVAGVSHFIEHLLFKGTKSFGPGQIAQQIEGAGGQLNAYTSFDQTVYYVTLGASEMDLGLKALSEMIFYPNFDKTEVDREREVVIEEIRRGQDEPSRVNSQFAFKSFFKNHPYGRPIIGYDHVVNTITVENIKKYFFEKYHPEKTFLLITGDFDEKTLDKKVNEYFDIEPKVKSSFKEISEVLKQTQKEFVLQKTNFEETVMNFYWPSAPLNTKDFICLEILALILGQGESSYFYKYLKLEMALVKTIGCYAYSLKQPGVFAINFKPLVTKELEAVTVFNKAIQDLCLTGLSELDFQKAIVNFKSELFYSMETCDGMARLVGQNYFYTKNENYTDEYLKILDELSMKDVEDVFEKYILNIPPKLYISTFEKTDLKEVETYFDQKFKSAFKLKKNNKEANKVVLMWKHKKQQDNHIQKIDLSNGVRLFLKQQNETPVVQIDMAMLGGEKIDPQKGILSLLTQKCWGRETDTMNESEVVFGFDNMASAYSVFSGKHSLGAQATTLSPNFEKILKWSFDLIKKTTVSQKIIDREILFLKQQYENRKDNPVQMVFHEFMKQIFSGHYYENDSLENLSKLSEVKANELTQFINSHFDFKNMVFAVVGDIEKNKVVDMIEEGLSGISAVKQNISFNTYAGIKENKFKKIDLKKEQAQIIYGFNGLKFADKRRPILSVIQAILSGQGGRLFIELRDKESLAYTVSPIRMEGQEAGYFGSYIACAPAKKEKAIQMMKAEFEKLANVAVGQEELNYAKKSLMGQAQIALQRNSEICEKILFDSIYGLPYDNYLNYAKEINAVTSEDILTLMKDLLSSKHVLVTLG